MQFPGRQTPKKTHWKSLSLESPSRTARKTHLRKRPQTEKSLLVPAKVGDRGLGLVTKDPPRQPPHSARLHCLDVGCTWPCAHHLHATRHLEFCWYPELDHCGYQDPEIPRVRSEMEDCKFCQIFFSIGKSDCDCGANARDDHMLKNGGCRCKYAWCYFRPNGQLCYIVMTWTCGEANYELGLSLARDARNFPNIAPCVGDLHDDPGSDESLALMKGWMDNCRRRHQLCMKVPRQAGRPKRLLQCLSDGSVRLTQSPTQRDYITLSYCWGDGTAVKRTTTKTLDLHHHGIPKEELPRLFQEVFALARGLEIGYLWIDSLCIIQDSPEDKAEEIPKMCDIYRGASAVVIAAWAQSPLDSLLGVKRRSGQTQTWRTASLIHYEEMDLVHVKFRKRPWDEAHLVGDATYFTPISARAWCLQEKLLASRCLVFCGDEVEYRSCCLCECGGEQEHFSVGGVGPIPMMKMTLRYRKLRYIQDRSRRDSAFEASVLDGWTTVKGPNLYGAVSDGAIVLSGVHCDVEMTIPERGHIQLAPASCVCSG